MKRVLLLGDSIRLNYMPYVYRKLSPIAEVCGPEENCRFSKYVLWSLDDWMGDKTYDVIHFNCGLWDCTRRPTWNYELFCTPEEYEQNLRRILERLQKTGAHLILATCTPVGEGQLEHRNEDVLRFNEVLRRLAAEYGIELNDLHALMSADPEKCLHADRLHLTKSGIRLLGDQVISVIRPYLEETV